MKTKLFKFCYLKNLCSKFGNRDQVRHYVINWVSYTVLTWTSYQISRSFEWCTSIALFRIRLLRKKMMRMREVDFTRVRATSRRHVILGSWFSDSSFRWVPYINRIISHQSQVSHTQLIFDEGVSYDTQVSTLSMQMQSVTLIQNSSSFNQYRKITSISKQCNNYPIKHFWNI